MVANHIASGGLVKGIAAASTLALALCIGQGTTAYAAAVDEQEPNDSFETANVIKMNQTVYGAYEGWSSDYFSVDLPQNGTVKMSYVELNPSTKWHWGVEAFIYDRYHESYLAKQIMSATTSRVQSITLPLRRGTNYIRLYQDFGYSGDYHFKLTYSIGGTNVTKLTPAKKSFSTSWVKKSGAASYQVRYTPKSTYKLYGWDQAVKMTVSKSSGSTKVSGLKSKTPYYVQVRVAQTIDGETYYSSWTGKKTVTTK